MIVTFISQCKKKSLNKTRRVLDSFANRIGSRTWQTIMTNEGLHAVKKLLRKTASKNTAVSCHWIRSRTRIELVWIVGNRNQFNSEGCVPVNTTRQNIINTHWENNWNYLPLIKSLSALSALFHDWGKASEFFQSKLKSKKILADPLRHEWISVLFLQVFVNGENDQQWLSRLSKGEIDREQINLNIDNKSDQPLKNLPNAASLVAWLIVTHHRLPLPIKEEARRYKTIPVDAFQTLLGVIDSEWGYENKKAKQELKRCFDYPVLPSESRPWLKQIKKWSNRLYDNLSLLNQSLNDGSWRVVLHHARLSLMLADHHYSSLDRDMNWQSPLKFYANTDRKTGKLKQQLDEHLVGVMKKSLKIAHLLPMFEGSSTELFPRAYDVKALKRKSTNTDFRWQDTAVSQIIKWRNQGDLKQSQDHFGFFAINMASTGKGKTFANAKIMRSLSSDKNSLRYILALGLRTLTLQTGDEYRDRIGLDETELAVLIGSKAVLDLHNRNKTQGKYPLDAKDNEDFGSESLENLLDNEIDYESNLPEDILATIFNTPQGKKNRKFLYAPVLTCTIDHLIAATETKRGGRYILPCLRLMSSDLVIDEIDNFEGSDLVAIGRLIHLAGMLGRKVMISSATISPDLAEGYFNAYQSGWSLFANSRNMSQALTCIWVDEFVTHIDDINTNLEENRRIRFKERHQAFIHKRVGNLAKLKAKRKAKLLNCQNLLKLPESDIENQYYQTIKTEIISQHEQHYSVEQQSKKQVSFGVVRVANIKPCIHLTEYLAESYWSDEIEIKVMAYHSQQALLMRSYQENHLDSVLKRDNNHTQAIFENAVIRNHLEQCQHKNLIFILVTTPVEEVGRDHDFDWAIIEPSSFRSIIQLSGRVLRHRDIYPQYANIALLQYNLKSLTQKNNKATYCQPGYETQENLLDSHDLNQLVNFSKLIKRIDAQPRIQRKSRLNPQKRLSDLEHYSIQQLLTDYENQGAVNLQGYLSGCWWMTALPQCFNAFREGSKQHPIYLMPELADETYSYVEKVYEKGKMLMPPPQTLYKIHKKTLSKQQQSRLWLPRDYLKLLKEIAVFKGMDIQYAALLYGELILPSYGKDAISVEFTYNEQLGLTKY